MPNQSSISKNGKEYISLSLARNKLNCSTTLIKGLCASGDLVCIKVGGSWHIQSDSLAQGLKMVQRKRSKKNILISKLRNSEKSLGKSSFSGIKRIIGREIRRK